ncbi:aminotransferase class I/II-fold pyridoxal phosphate-dependent enzyme (plasmid) [Ensifer adhaerens]|uniref:trans-sulfuration enzyme family protein n=2 Tax=Ensifer adhaerens TaxID=106592 RepID=UPI001CBF15BC|nr:aminotransferase class I/II-fold pyridoxal phosphate-dependent enzyme [Ensifer adhaerens]UAX97961.1 aminotransferase class I/II-fold pyridoxal phosphate-dependent enzyme [Ensifer adhaerens]UAY05340.1 aminotransferase class I/II-fold pyridoxal phosphate-dependent enzyme [Ensifer adhaerens]UAY12718.1 aminotransferase class I/II-fold pyridoxal phosphate-dependent enzyme [Ensifer adhaerens]
MEMNWSKASLLAQAMGKIDETTRAVTPPIHVTSTFIRDPDNEYRSGNVYGRPDNETVREAESVLSMLEGASSTLVFGSGMSAATAVFLALKPGDHVVAPKVMYWALRNWLMNDAVAWGLNVDFVDMTDLDTVAAAIKPDITKLVWVETPSNPLWSVTDVAAVAAMAEAAGAKFAVDSTVATPILSQPLALGADIVMHSATKYLNGHSDVIAGALSTKRDDAFWGRIRRNRSMLGQILGPVEAFLLLRGMRTLDLRVRTQSASALTLAARFASHPRILDVLYPGLPSHPGHELAARQMSGGFGGMLSIRVRAGEEAAIRTAANVRLWKRATSLGGVESLLEHRASIEGQGSPCPTDLLRLSVGLESPDDLIVDLEGALDVNS